MITFVQTSVCDIEITIFGFVTIELAFERITIFARADRENRKVSVMAYSVVIRRVMKINAYKVGRFGHCK